MQKAEIQWNYSLSTVCCGGYTVWILIGYYLANTDIKKSFRIFIYILGLLGFFMYFTLQYKNPLKPETLTKPMQDI